MRQLSGADSSGSHEEATAVCLGQMKACGTLGKALAGALLLPALRLGLDI